MASAALPRPVTTPPRASAAAALADLVDAAERVGDAAQVLDGVADLLVARAGQLSIPQVGAFDEVMTVLAAGAGTKARGRLARRLGPLPRPPRRLARLLACDPEPSVAVPVLARCAALPDTVLMQVARSRGPVHLAAIARRETVAARVADILADRGDEAVMGTLLRNAGAQLSLAALSLLSERMEDRDGLARGLAARPGLRAAQRDALVRPRAPSARGRPAAPSRRSPCGSASGSRNPTSASGSPKAGSPRRSWVSPTSPAVRRSGHRPRIAPRTRRPWPWSSARRACGSRPWAPSCAPAPTPPSRPSMRAPPSRPIGP